MSTLRQKMLEELRIRNYSDATIRGYIHQVKKYAEFFDRSPEHLGPDQVRSYQVHLVEHKCVSLSTLTQVVCALRFLYRTTLKRDWRMDLIPYPRQEKKLPVILSRKEVYSLFREITNPKYRTILQTMYASGLRITEAVSLRISDIDSDRMQIRVRLGKGRKERLTVLSPTLLSILRSYWDIYRPREYLFESRGTREPLTRKSLQLVCPVAARKAGIKKRVTPHTMRHCFATHLLDAGNDLRTIQILLGHTSIRSTQRYLHVTTSMIKTAGDQLDLLQLVLPDRRGQ